MYKIKSIIIIFILTFLSVITFLECIGSVSVIVSPAIEAQYQTTQINLSRGDVLDLSEENIFTYGLSFTTPKIYQVINRDDRIGGIKLNIKTITLNLPNGHKLTSFNIGQKTSIFDLFAPTSKKFIATNLNKPFISSLSDAFILKSGLLVAFIITSLVALFIYLKSHLNLIPQIVFNSGSQIYPIKKVFAYCVIIFLLSKILFVVEYFYLVKYIGFGGNFFSNMCNADVGFYRQIIHEGYVSSLVDGVQANVAFFPLFPILVKTLMLLGLPEISGVYLNQILLFGTFIILFMYIQENYNLIIAKFAILFLSIAGENIYFMTLYSESSYLFFSVLSIYLLSKNKLGWASICSGLLSANRFIGFVMVVPIFFKSIRQNSLWKTLLYCVISVSGLLIFMLYLHFHVHDFLAFYHIQNVWRHTLELSWIKNPFWTIYMTLVRSNLIDKFLFVMSFFILALFYKYKKYNEFFLLAILMLATFSSKSLGSYTRFFFAAFPIYIYLGIYVATKYDRIIAITSILLFMNFLYLVFWLEKSGSAW